ncbi:MAG: hypothetical protein AUF79_08305 [Crenarchaeota archaeon 13_1_20CM_2_51_8]|nr:MAG: hypothetical protein AUF79_08305 [Crenarchaeota archaeon 13_1_20CM_2_51_8]
MIKSDVEGLRKAWPWVIVVVLFLTGVIYLVLLHFGTVLTASAVVELEKAVIQINGLLIAFTGIIFTGMLAEVRFRTERALQKTDQQRVDRLDRMSKALRKSAFFSFLFFSGSLADAIGNLAAALSSMSSTYLMASVFVLPVMLMVGGLALLMVALALIALE